MLGTDVRPGPHLPEALVGASGPRCCPLTGRWTPAAKDTTRSGRASDTLVDDLVVLHSNEQKDKVSWERHNK